MILRTRILSAVVFAALFAATAPAQEPIRFARTPDISHDGKTVAFSYLGDIWTVEAIGGIAKPITMHEAHDFNPCFSPDGKWIAFSSNRYGSYDVFVVAAYGGKPRRLTYDSGQDIVNGWSPDGKSVVFSSTRGTAYPSGQDVYTVPVEGGREQKLSLFEAKEAHFSPVGGLVAFARGPGVWYRKGYRGSSNDELWVANADGTNSKRLTNFDGQDGSPMWSPDGKKVYYVTENGGKRGCANVVVQDVAGGSARPITTHQDESVRKARISGNGEWIVYELGGDIWVTSTKGGTARKLAIEVHADDKSNTAKSTTFTRDATEFQLSPDEAHAVVVVHGELFLVKTQGSSKAMRMTESPAYDHAPAWSPDGKKIIFASDRNGVEDLYLLQPDDPEHPELTKAHKFKTTQLTKSDDAESGVSFSPKGDVVAFIRAGKLWTMKPDGTDQKILVDSQQVFDYDWSPDGKYVAFARMDGSFASELYIVPSDGSEKPRNVTRYATYNGDVSWSGNKISFVSQRRGTYAMHVLSLQKPAAPGSSGPAPDIDWDDIHTRVTRPAGMSAESGTLNHEGNQIAFRSMSNGDDLWVVSTDGSNLGRVTSGNQSPKFIKWSKKNAGTIYFLNSAGEIRSTRASLGGFTGTGGPVSEPGKVAFSAKMTVNRDEEFGEMYAQAWRALSDFFYDPQHHGAHWPTIREKYRPLVEHVATKEDLYALVSLMLGELNASHLGISGKLPTPDEFTADLGLIFDESYRGPGLKVAEVLKRGPADRRGLNIAPGDIITAIDRVELTDKINVSQLLNNKAGEAVRLDIAASPGDSKTRRRVEVFAADRSRISNLMYERWIAKNAEQVDKQSGGKLGYIHIPSMDEAGLESFVRALYSDNFDKEAIVLDVRYNGGGFTHDQVLNYLTGKEHTYFRQRNGGEGLVLRSHDRKWTKPVSVLINNRSYSDAEIFPHAFRALGVGKVIGQATGGHVIGTTSLRLIDGSQFRLPRTGVYTNRGVNMDKEGVAPDIAVEIDPKDWAKGIDTQITKAVSVLQEDVVAWKKAKGMIASGPEPKPGPNTTVTTPAPVKP